MIYLIPIEWHEYITTTTDENGDETDTVDTTMTPAEILKEMKELDADVYAAEEYHVFEFVNGVKA